MTTASSTASRGRRGTDMTDRIDRLTPPAAVIADVLQYLFLREFSPHGFCGLCGNVGAIDTRGVTTPAGHPAGDVFFCICPNGRALKQHGGVTRDDLLQRLRAAAPEPGARHTSCRYCELDIEGIAPYPKGEWRDRGNNRTCPHGPNKGKLHAPVP